MAAQNPDYSKILSQFPIFRELSERARQFIAVTPVSYDAGKIVFRQGDPIMDIYLILSGHVTIERRARRNENKLIRQVGPNQVFGRLEVDTLEGQLGTAVVTEPCQLLLIDKQTLVELRDEHPELSNQFDRSEVIGHLRSIAYLASLSDLEIKWISDIVTIEQAEKDQTLYKTGRRDDRLILIRQGRVRVTAGGGASERWVSAGSVLGDRSTIRGLRRSSTAVTDAKCRYYLLPGNDLRMLARFYPEADWLSDPISVEVGLQQTPLFQRLTLKEIRLLAGYTMQLHLSQPDNNIVRQGKADSYYYMLTDGSAKSQQAREGDNIQSPVILYPGSSFGEASLLLGEPAKVTVETREVSNWLRIHRKDFRLFLEDHPEAESRLTIDHDLRVRLRGLEQVRDWQEEGESILVRVRRHWIVLFRNISAIAAVYIFLILINLGLAAVFQIPGSLRLLQPLAVICIPLPFAIWIILDYLNDYHIVTTKRIAHEERVILISERRTSAPLDKVQNQEVQRGFWAQILGYGHLMISTAAEEGLIVFDFLPNVYEVMNLINDESAKARAGVVVENEEMIREQIQDRLHLGLEEKFDERALIEEAQRPLLKKRKRRASSFFNRFIGIQEHPGNTLVWRKHWLGLMITTFFPFLLIVASTAMLALMFTGAIFENLAQPLQVMLAVLFLFTLLASIFWLWWDWTDWRNDRYILTDQYIEHVEKKPWIFEEQRQITTLERVQNVQYEKPNPIYVLLNFGNVFIQTAATEGLVTFRYVPEPDFIQAEIYHRIENYRETQANLRSRERQNEIIDWLETYHKLVNRENHIHSNQ